MRTFLLSMIIIALAACGGNKTKYNKIPTEIPQAAYEPIEGGSISPVISSPVTASSPEETQDEDPIGILALLAQASVVPTPPPCVMIDFNKWAEGGYSRYTSNLPVVAAQEGCSKPTGFFVMGPALFYSNGTQFCHIASPEQRDMNKGFSPVGIPTLYSISTSLQYGGACSIPAALFFSGASGYYSNGIGHYCAFDNWNDFAKVGGTVNVPRLPFIQSNMINDGICRP